MAEMVGGFAAWVEGPDELRPALEAALDAGTVAVLNVRTDRTKVSEILRGIGQLGVM
jgi:thiamine pyrophosphate-dependent acetolactate synthase large subunit-like protein